MAPKNGLERYFDDLEDDDGNDGEEYYDNGNGFDYGGDDNDDHSSGRPRSNVDFDAIFPSFAGCGGYEDNDDDHEDCSLAMIPFFQPINRTKPGNGGNGDPFFQPSLGVPPNPHVQHRYY
jgi:hypothetical protein